MKIDIQKHISDKKNWPGSFTALLIILIAIVVIHLIKPLFDPDFYWHLKTGAWIWDYKVLPAFDPFTIPPQPVHTERSQFILSSYWLFQLLLYAFYKMGGFGGIIFFRFIIVAIFIGIFYRVSVHKKLSVAVVAGIGIIPILDSYFPERPQFISFVCSALLLSIVFKPLKGKKSWLTSLLIPLCLTMLLWANMHGGFLLGQIVLMFILFAEALKFTHPNLSPVSSREFLKLAVAIISALLISFLNPNHINSLKMLFTSGETNNFLYTSNLEYSNLYEYFKIMGDYVPIIAVCTYIGTFIIFVCSRERTNITWMGLLAIFGYMGFLHIRYYPFFLVCATLFAIQYFDARVIGKTSRYILFAFFIAVVSMSFPKTPRNLQIISRYGWVPASYYPVKVCDFVDANGINGNVFTTMDWGGYVIWRLAPHQKVFFDGRQLDPSRYWEYLNSHDMGWASPYWKTLFDKYNIQVVILPIMESSSRPFPLTKAIEMDAGWRLVNIGNNGALFVRK